MKYELIQIIPSYSNDSPTGRKDIIKSCDDIEDIRQYLIKRLGNFLDEKTRQMRDGEEVLEDADIPFLIKFADCIGLYFNLNETKL